MRVDHVPQTMSASAAQLFDIVRPDVQFSRVQYNCFQTSGECFARELDHFYALFRCYQLPPVGRAFLPSPPFSQGGRCGGKGGREGDCGRERSRSKRRWILALLRPGHPSCHPNRHSSYVDLASFSSQAKVEGLNQLFLSPVYWAKFKRRIADDVVQRQ